MKFLNILNRVLSALLLCGVCGTLAAQSVETGVMAGRAFCPGSGSALPFTATGSFGAGNVFTAQVSDSTGSFANPVAIGTLTATSSGTIPVTLPSGILPGSGYRVRIVASNPAITGSASAGSFQVFRKATINNPGTLYTCFTGYPTRASYTFSGTGSSYNWSIDGPYMGFQESTGLNTLSFDMAYPTVNWQVTASANGSSRGYIAVANLDYQSFYLYDAVSYQPLAAIEIGDEVYDASINPTATKAATYVFFGNRLYIIDLATRALSQRITTPAAIVAGAIAYSVDGNTLYAGLTNGQIVGYNVNTGTLVSTIAAPSSGLKPVNMRAAVDGQRLFVVYSDPRVAYNEQPSPQSELAILNLATGATLASAPTEDYAYQLRVDPNGSQVFVNSDRGGIRVHSTSNAAQLARIFTGHSANRIAVGANGRLYALSDRLEIFSTTNYALTAMFPQVYGDGITVSDDGGTVYIVESSYGPVMAYSADLLTPLNHTELLPLGVNAQNDFANIAPVTCPSQPISFTLQPVLPPSAAISYAGGPYCTSGGTVPVNRTGTATGRYFAPAGLSVDAATGAIDLAHSQQGIYTVSYRAGNPACDSITATTNVQVFAAVPTSISYPGSPYCASSGTVPVFFSGFNGGTFSSTAGLSVNASTGAIDLGASQAGTYTVTYTANNGSCNIIANTSVTIRPNLVVFSGNQNYCAGAATPAVSFHASTGIIYSWTNSDPSIGLAASGTGDIPSFVAQNNGVTEVSAGIAILAQGGTGCKSQSMAFRIRVSPRPAMNGVSDLSACAGAYTTQSFAGNTMGTTYSWTSTNAATGIPASGTGALVFTGQNNTASPSIASTVTVTPRFNGCGGTPVSFIATVNRSVTSLIYANSPYCPSGSAKPLLNGTAGGSYSSTAGLSINASTGIINLEISTSGTYTVTYTASNTAGGCGNTAQATITVRPVDAGLAAVSNRIFCAGSAVAATPFAGTAGSFTWSNGNTAIGLPASGTGTALPPFTAQNPTTVPATAYITVAPVAGAGQCAGKSSTFRIVVNPIPSVNDESMYNDTFCRQSAVDPVTFSGPVAGTAYTWTASGTASGLPTLRGTASIPGFLARNPTASLLATTITVRPVAAGCAGPARTFTLYVDDCEFMAGPPPDRGRQASITATDLQLSPNPASGSSASVRYTGRESGPFLVQLLDAWGSPVSPAVRIGGTTAVLDLSGLRPGSYLVRFVQEKTGVSIQRTLIRL